VVLSGYVAGKEKKRSEFASPSSADGYPGLNFYQAEDCCHVNYF